MRLKWARTAPMLLVLLVGLLSGCPEPIDDSSIVVPRKKPSATPTMNGIIGGATPTPSPSPTPTSNASPAGNIDQTLKTPTPLPSPTPTPTLAPLVTPVPVVTQPTPSATPQTLPSDPIGPQQF